MEFNFVVSGREQAAAPVAGDGAAQFAGSHFFILVVVPDKILGHEIDRSIQRRIVPLVFFPQAVETADGIVGQFPTFDRVAFPGGVLGIEDADEPIALKFFKPQSCGGLPVFVVSLYIPWYQMTPKSVRWIFCLFPVRSTRRRARI